VNPNNPGSAAPHGANAPPRDTLAPSEPSAVAELAAALRARRTGPSDALGALAERAARLVPAAARPMIRIVVDGLITHDPTLVAMQRDLERLVPSTRLSKGLPMNDESEIYKVRFPLEQDEDGYPPASDELLWAQLVSSGVYRVDNIPFFVRGISLGDEVCVDTVHGELVYRSVHRQGGHRTIRLLVGDETQVPRIRDELRAIGCSSELSHIPILVAVDVPRDVSAAVIRAYLDRSMHAGTFEYEEGSVEWT
jgi:hypothetical protein